MEHESGDYINCKQCSWYRPPKNWYKDWRIWKITGAGGGLSKTTALLRLARILGKSPGNLRRLAVTETPVKTQQLTLMWKALSRRGRRRHDLEVEKWSIGKGARNWKFIIQLDGICTKPQSILGNKTQQKSFWEYEIQTDYLLKARRPDLVILNKKKNRETYRIVGLCCPHGPQSKKSKKKKRQRILRSCHKTKKDTMEQEGDGNTNRSWWNSEHFPKGLVRELVEFEIGGWAKNHWNYSIVEVGQNTKKSPWRPEGTCCHSDSTERPSAKVGVKKTF